MTTLRPPEPFTPGSNPALAWQEYKERYKIFSSASKLDKEDKEYQKNVFLHVLGIEGIRIYKTLKIGTDATIAPLTHIMDAFDSYYKPYRSINYSRYRFFTTKQSKHQTFDQFFTALKTLAPACALGELQDSITATIILTGTKSPEARKKMLQIDDLSLEEAISIRQAEESSTEHLQFMTSASTGGTARTEETLDSVEYHRTRPSRGQYQNRPFIKSQRLRAASETYRYRASQQYQTRPRARSLGNKDRYATSQNCNRCGLSHPYQQCPAEGARCRSCGGMNHWASTCRSIRSLEELTTHQTTENSWEPHLVSQNDYVTHEDYFLNERSPREDYDTTDETLYLNSLTLYTTIPDDTPQAADDDTWKTTLEVASRKITFKIDTGSQVNVIPINLYQQLPDSPPLMKPLHRIRAYSRHSVAVMGMVFLPCSSQVAKTYSPFYVTPSYATPILSGKASTALGLIVRLPHNVHTTQKKIYATTTTATSTKTSITETGTDKGSFHAKPREIIESFNDVFNKIGKLPGKHDLRLKPHVNPTICAPRRIPVQLRDDVQEELKRMLKNDVIEEVKEPSAWVHPMVVVRKDKHQDTVEMNSEADQLKKSNSKVRICLDPRNLNSALLRTEYPMPTTQEIYTDLASSKYFTVLDAQSAFWQVQLTKTSSRLCTFATPFGRYRFKRLPYGIAIASQLFQEVMEKIFGDIPNVRISTDDFVIHGPDLETHNKALVAVLKRARQEGLTFGTSKMQLAVSQIKYLGHIISDKGLQADPTKIKAITELPPPPDKAALQRFLGMVNYLAKFIPAYSERTSTLRNVLKPTVEYHWDANLQRAYDDVKMAISTSPVLKLFNPKEPCLLSVDASQYGVGAVLLQDNHPIEYASMTFNTTQVRYAQIEKELLAVLFACEHYHFYIAGAPITVQTDHRPLLAVIKKPFNLMSPRLQRLTLRLARYDPTLVYVPGSKLYVADTLSRAPLPESSFDTSYLEGPNATVYSLTIMSHEREEKFRTETTKDKTLQTIIRYTIEGWPRNRSKIAGKDAQLYWPIQEELNVENGLLYRGNRLVVPQTLQNNTLEQIHSAHQGTTSCLAKARIHVYWPNMAKDIKDYIRHCSICRTYDRANSATPIQPLPIPIGPWNTVGTDLFHHQGRNYILLVDYYSKFVEVQEMTTTTAHAVIKFLAPQIARYGAPQKLISDNGPPYNSAAFEEFLSYWNIEHVTSSPHHPQTNGLSERMVQTLKNLLDKAITTGKTLNEVLLEYRTTPKSELPSPAEILMGRRLRTQLTTNQASLNPHYPTRKITEALENRQQNMVRQANQRPNKSLPELQRGDQVRYLAGPRHWVKAVIQEKERFDSYIIRSANGRLYRRTRIHLRLANEKREHPTSKESVKVNLQVNLQKATQRSKEEPEPTISIRIPDDKRNKQNQPRAQTRASGTDERTIADVPTTYAEVLKSPRQQPSEVKNQQITRSGRVSKKPTPYICIP